MRWVRLILVACLAAAAAVPLDAQSREGGLNARMGDFLREAREHGDLESFFPRGGDVTWVLTVRGPSRDTVTRWRFPPGDVPRAMALREALCESFSRGGDVGLEGTLMHWMTRDEGPWRRAGAARFVPPGAPARSPTFVEWRRERGQWVIAAFGEERPARLRVLGTEPNSLVREVTAREPALLPLPVDDPYAAGTPWFEAHDDILVNGRRLSKYGLPRPLQSGDVTRIGTVNGVAAFAETGAPGVGVIYVAVDRHGLFQPYQGMTGDGCP